MSAEDFGQVTAGVVLTGERGSAYFDVRQCPRCALAADGQSGRWVSCNDCGHVWPMPSPEVEPVPVTDVLGTGSLTMDRLRRYLTDPVPPEEDAGGAWVGGIIGRAGCP